MADLPKPFLVLATVRTGSYNLVSLLDSAPDLACYGEIYKARSVELPDEERAMLGLGPGDVEARDAMGEALLERLRARHKGTATGFKLFPNHIRANPFLRELLLSGRYKVVILSRPVLEIFVSLELANQTGTFVVTDPTARQEEPQLTATAEALAQTEKFIGRFRAVAQKVRAKSRVEHIDIRYAETQEPRHLGRVLEFLGSDARPQDLISAFHRQSSRRLHERVENWEWLCHHLRETDRLALLGEAGYRADGTPF